MRGRMRGARTRGRGNARARERASLGIKIADNEFIAIITSGVHDAYHARAGTRIAYVTHAQVQLHNCSPIRAT